MIQVPCLITLVNTIAERLKLARELKQWTQEDLAHSAGVKQGTIGNIEAGLRKRPRDLLAIAKALSVRPEWLQDGQGHMSVSDPPSVPNATMSDFSGSTVWASSDTKLIRAPVVEWARLGEVLFRSSSELEGSSFESFVPTRAHSLNVKLVQVVDDSLSPRIAPGDWVAIDPDNKTPDRGSVTLFRAKTDGAFFLRRFQPLTSPAFEAVDAKGNVMDSSRHSLEIVGVACGVRMSDL